MRPLLCLFPGGGGGFLLGEIGPPLLLGSCTGKDVSAAGLLGGGGGGGCFDVVDVVGKLDNAAGGFGGSRDGDFTGDTMFCSCGAAGMGTFSELVRKLLYSSSLLPSVSTDSMPPLCV